MTPEQTEGPFYPLTLPLDNDNDLAQVEGRTAQAAGTLLHLGGRVLGPDGRAAAGVRVEIWQCDAHGVYHHPGDRRGPADEDFQGFGHAIADEQGGYRFRTIAPVAYPGRTPHIHVKIFDGGTEALTTQMYVAGNPENERDGLYRRLGRAAELVTVTLEPEAEGDAMRALFDITLGPDGSPSSG
jgi:protocatechuate 3,4-dioxygenase beta subunit